MTAYEFSLEIGVTYTTVRSWLRRGMVPGAVRNELGRWDVPAEALKMEKPQKGRRPSGDLILRTRRESRQLAELQDRCERLEEELKELKNKEALAHTNYMLVSEELRREKLAVASQQLIIDKWIVERSSHDLPKEDD